MVDGELRTHLERLYPICRSISGPGLRATLDYVSDQLEAAAQIELKRTRVPTGTQIFDWTIGDEWTIRSGFLATLSGERIVDFADHNLHVVGYSTPIDEVVSRDDLEPHLHSLPEHPDWIPFRTSFYSKNWGFCLTQRQREQLTEPAYHVVIDSTLEPGGLDYGEVVLPGERPEEVLFSAHVCHPSLANDNLSGIAVAIELAKHVARLENRRYTYRFLFAPGTIGSLSWLALNPEARTRITAGVTLTGLGGPGELVYKATKSGDAHIDDAATHVVRQRGGSRRPYSPWGYDERQFNAVGFGLPVGRLTRTPHGEYPEYHTSADDLEFVSTDHLTGALEALIEIVSVLETDCVPVNLSPFGEPQLGKHGLYPSMGGQAANDAIMAMLWTLGYADGSHSLLQIAEVSQGIAYRDIWLAARKLEDAGLLAREH